MVGGVGAGVFSEQGSRVVRSPWIHQCIPRGGTGDAGACRWLGDVPSPKVNIFILTDGQMQHFPGWWVCSKSSETSILGTKRGLRRSTDWQSLNKISICLALLKSRCMQMHIRLHRFVRGTRYGCRVG